MPIGSTSYRNVCSHYENKIAKYMPDSQVQQQANHISVSQTQKAPQTCCLTSALYGSAAILNCMSCVMSSNLSTPDDLPKQKDKQEYASASSINTIGFIGTVHKVSLPSLQQYPLASRSTITSNHQTRTHFHAASPVIIPESQPKPNPVIQNPVSTDWCGLPMAFAQSADNGMEDIHWNEREGEWVAEEDNGKRKLLDMAQYLLENTEELSQSEIDTQRLEWEIQAAGAPIMITALPLRSLYARNKRISFKQQEQVIIRHIEENCATQEQLTDLQGKNKGSTLLFVANILDMSTSHLLERDAPQWKKITSKIADLGIFVITLGMTSAIGSPMAALLRKIYFRMNKDHICATRFGHIAIASLGTGISIGGTGGPTYAAPKAGSHNPLELQNSISFKPRASYISNNKATNIKTTVLLTAKRKTTSGDEEKVMLVPKSDVEFEALPLDTAIATGNTKDIRYDTSTGIWHDMDITGGPLLDVAFIEGEKFIVLQGKKYQLLTNGQNQYNIKVDTSNGENKLHAVYQEPITKKWLLKTENGNPIFSTSDRNVIEHIKINNFDSFQYRVVKTTERPNPKTGPRFEIRNKQDDPEKTVALYEVIEMNGAVLRVRKTVNKNQEESFCVIDPKAPNKPERPVEWDGARWRFLKVTSRFVSAALNRRITRDIFAKELDDSLLSPPDGQGIRWADGRGYLNVRGEYVEIHQGLITEIGTAGGKRIPVYYSHQQFYPIKADAQAELKRKVITEKFIDSLKDKSSQQLPVDITVSDIEKATRSVLSSLQTTRALPPLAASATGLGSATPALRPLVNSEVKVEVMSIASSELDKKRYLITLSDDEQDYFILEISRDGKHVNVLLDQDSDLAMEKHQRSLSGTDIPNVIALKRNVDEPLFRANTREQINTIATQRIESGAEVFRSTLEQMKTKGSTGKTMIVGHADFLSTASFENNVFTTPENAYLALIDFFIPLSREYPDTIIIPGSIYISRDIPKGMLRKALIYQQGEMSREVRDAINFSSVIVPVIYNGRFVTIGRKGECLTYTREDAPTYEDPRWLLDLDAHIPRGATIKVNNAKFNPFSTPSEWVDARTGTIFAGKTLMPGEKLHADWFFCPCLDGKGSAVDIDYFFKNEFMIGDNKFLLVIEDEFIQKADTRPIIRHLAFPKNETVEESNRYDWIIHTAVVNEIDDNLRSAGTNYLYAPSHSNSQFHSELNERVLTKTSLHDKKLSIFEFSSKLSSKITPP